MNKYKINFKQLLTHAYWGHPDFGIVAKFLSDPTWENEIWDESVVTVVKPVEIEKKK